MALSLAQAQALLDAAVAAYQEAATSQEYSKGDRRLKRADLAALSADITKYSQIVQRLESGIKITGATPC